MTCDILFTKSARKNANNGLKSAQKCRKVFFLKAGFHNIGATKKKCICSHKVKTQWSSFSFKFVKLILHGNLEYFVA